MASTRSSIGFGTIDGFGRPVIIVVLTPSRSPERVVERPDVTHPAGTIREFFMPRKPENHCLGTAIAQVRTFLKEFGCRLVDTGIMEETIRGIAKARGEDWPWVEKWFPECPDGGPVYRRLKRCFPLLELSQAGLCATCERATRSP